MLDTTIENHQLELQWKSYCRVYEGETYEITYQNEKKKDQSLKDFIIEEDRKGATVDLDYLIDGINLTDWLNEHYFEREVLGVDYKNNLSYAFTEKTFEDKFFQFRKIDCKRILGQLLTLEDGIEFKQASSPELNEEELLEAAKNLQKEENGDTMLYCSGCCGDRLCGYFGIKIYHTEKHVVWFFKGENKDYKLPFLKAPYFNAFREYVETINVELEGIGLPTVSLEASGEKKVAITTQIEQLKEKYKLDDGNLSIESLKKILQQGKVVEINAALYWAQELKLDISPLEAHVETTYEQLSKQEKDSISWKIIDNRAYFQTLELCQPTLIEKAVLLFGSNSR